MHSETTDIFRNIASCGPISVETVLRGNGVLSGTTLRTPLISGVRNSGTYCFHVCFGTFRGLNTRHLPLLDKAASPTGLGYHIGECEGLWPHARTGSETVKL